VHFLDSSSILVRCFGESGNITAFSVRHCANFQ
jgi:hypothetical protein